MPNESRSPALFLCAGKDCFRDERAAFDALRSRATDAGLEVDTIRCQGSCAGPTAVVDLGQGPRWFERLQTTKVQIDLVQYASGTEAIPTTRLAKRELTGKRRKKAAKKLRAA